MCILADVLPLRDVLMPNAEVDGGCSPFQLPRVIEGGVGVYDSREFDLHLGWHWQLGGGGLHSG